MGITRNITAMNRIIFFAIAFVTLGSAAAQESSYLHNRITLERMGSQGAGGASVPLASMGAPKPGIVGDVYLNQDYRNATFLLYDENKVAKGYPSKLDLQRNEFDIKLQVGIRTLAGSQVKSLVWSDSASQMPQYFVNGKEFKDAEDAPYYGFFQILAEGELTLLKMTTLTFKPADRAVVHSVGNKDNQFLKKAKLYYAIGPTALKLPGKKGIRQLFGPHMDAMLKFIEVNQIDLDKESHVQATFEYFNSLAKK